MGKKVSRPKKQTVVRVVKDREHPYVMIPRLAVDDVSLSWKARGILHYLIGRPNDWFIIIEHLVKQATDGKDSLMAGIKELKKAGYVQHFTYRYKGVILYKEYEVYEHPVKNPNPDSIHIELPAPPETENPVVVKPLENKEVVPETDFPDQENPDQVFPDQENPQLLNNDLLLINNHEVSNETTNYMVVEIKSLITSKFNSKELPDSDVLDLISFAQSKNKSITGAIENTYQYFISLPRDKRKINDLIGAIKYDLKKGWTLPKTANLDSTKKLPKTIAKEIDEPDFSDEELQGTYEDIQATMKFLRSTEKQAIKNNEEKLH